MPKIKNRQKYELFLFNLLEQNLPKQGDNEDGRQISTKEFILWMIGISFGVISLQYIIKLLF
jgi:hypothetical protein